MSCLPPLGLPATHEPQHRIVARVALKPSLHECRARPPLAAREASQLASSSSSTLSRLVYTELRAREVSVAVAKCQL
jgi:hypothetical protein